ncbi:MAG: MarR family transcriptional regulator [Rhodospirillaceae bacterium]|nr:MarR family transcriptional regulator [Rhodospirillaceae bacterium]MBT6118278.1 MarR family transcriptional regulator [Rhodospirillaceae bacterium]
MHSGRIAELLDRIGRATHCLQFADGLNPAQWETLRYLARANRYSRTPTALAEYLGTTKGTASQTLRSLEAKGYIRREKRSADRRSVALDLTESGHAVMEQDPMARLEDAAADLPDDLGGALADSLTGLLRGLKTACGGREFGVCAQCGHLDSSGDGTARCGLNGDTLAREDRARICVEFHAA